VVVLVDGAPQPARHVANASRQASRPFAAASVHAPMHAGLSLLPRQSEMQPRELVATAC
jgi:hypothetical protein